MSDSQYRIPKLLLGKYEGLTDLKKEIVNGHYSTLESEVSTCRFRGTCIDASPNDRGMLQIIGWQRNVTRLRNTDISLPTIISMDIETSDDTIRNIAIDSSFKGSKGPLCSRKYLHDNLTSGLIGLKMDKTLLANIKLEKLHCFHLMEVLGGIYTAYEMYCSKRLASANGKSFFEEEITDSYLDGNNLVVSGSIDVNGCLQPNYTIVIHNTAEEAGFSPNGLLEMKAPVKMDFLLNHELMISDKVLISGQKNAFRDLQNFMIRCVKVLKKAVFDEGKNRYLCTNIHPSTFVGLLNQGLSIRNFNSNNESAMHVLDSLQRPGGIPICIGGIKTSEEAGKYFPKYHLHDSLIQR